ncbi:peptidyl-prolyl cis-trans isomerase [Variovorax sp. GT1P44]|uniref:peptidylprolyl isomerase n=1 Tax=Variovorax sp. GT1P44 TaxID=3443742 RepID=UPI003F44C7EC
MHTANTEAAAQRPPTSRIGRWLREPLLHFLLIGTLLYVFYAWSNTEAHVEARPNQIVLTSDDLVQMTLTWRAQGRPMPTEREMTNLIETKVREEILYREGMALGLDKDDTIIKRRLAQKMEFVAEDLSALKEPTPDELRAWFDKNGQRFALAPRLTFTHRYYSPDKRQGAARGDAERALSRLGNAGATVAAAGADPFMFQDRYVDQSAEQVAALFGPKYAESLVAMKPGSWQGPVESGYGWHLVFVEELTPGRVPAYEEVEADVKQEWVAQQRADAKRSMYEAMRGRYEVVVSDTRPAPATATGAKPAADASRVAPRP